MTRAEAELFRLDEAEHLDRDQFLIAPACGPARGAPADDTAARLPRTCVVAAGANLDGVRQPDHLGEGDGAVAPQRATVPQLSFGVLTPADHGAVPSEGAAVACSRSDLHRVREPEDHGGRERTRPANFAAASDGRTGPVANGSGGIGPPADDRPALAPRARVVAVHGELHRVGQAQHGARGRAAFGGSAAELSLAVCTPAQDHAARASRAGMLPAGGHLDDGVVDPAAVVAGTRVERFHVRIRQPPILQSRIGRRRGAG